MGACDECGSIDESRLYGTVDAKTYCSDCWRDAGRPWPRRKATMQETAAMEQQTRERMLKRGGTDRYRARSGKS